MLFKISPTTSIERNKRRYYIFTQKSRYQIEKKLSDFLVSRFEHAFDDHECLSLSNSYEEAQSALGTLEEEGFIFKTRISNSKDRVGDRELIDKNGYKFVSFLKASKNGRVYVVAKNGHKFIFKFQKTKHSLRNVVNLHMKCIPIIHHHHDSPDQSWYVQEFVPGKTLFEIKDSGLYNRQKIIHQIQNIQNELQKVKFIHGDIHPGNFIYHHERVYLIDIDNGFLVSDVKNEQTFIKPTGLHGFIHPDILMHGRFPDLRTQAYSFQKVIDFL